MNEKKTKLWIGIGVATLMTGTVAEADEASTADAELPMEALQGGEGGERGKHDKAEGGEYHGDEGGERGKHHMAEGGEHHEGGERGKQDKAEGGEHHGDEGGEHHDGGEGGENHGAALSPAFNHFTAGAGAEGGEGGEGGATAIPSAVQSDGVYLSLVSLMKGELLEGREQVQAGDFEAGRVHFSHPWEHLYGPLKDGAMARGQKGLGHALEELAEHAEDADSWAEVEAEYDEAWGALNAAARGVTADDANRPRLVAEVSLALVKQAALDYEDAVSEGRIVDNREYEDARAGVRSASDYLQQNATVLKAANASAYKRALGVVNNMVQAWPLSASSSAAVRAPADVLADQSRFELAISPYLY